SQSLSGKGEKGPARTWTGMRPCVGEKFASILPGYSATLAEWSHCLRVIYGGTCVCRGPFCQSASASRALPNAFRTVRRTPSLRLSNRAEHLTQAVVLPRPRRQRRAHQAGAVDVGLARQMPQLVQHRGQQVHSPRGGTVGGGRPGDELLVLQRRGIH